MKKPRISDFDPNAAPELGSPMDGLPAIQPPKAGRVSADPPGERIRAPEAPEQGRIAPSVRPYARTLTRVPFEFYQDQIETLRQFSLAEKARGEKGSMSQMVREALDMYIAKRRRTEE